MTLIANTINEDVKRIKYVKTIKMYKILTQIHLNYKFKKITLKNICIHGLSDCLARRVKILDNMKKTLYALENKNVGN